MSGNKKVYTYEEAEKAVPFSIKETLPMIVLNMRKKEQNHIKLTG